MGEVDNLFDPKLGEELKEKGIDLAASNEANLLSIARDLAFMLASIHGDITADDVQEDLFKRTGMNLGPAAGALFRGEEWEFTGEWRASRRTSNHRHFYRVWRLRE